MANPGFNILAEERCQNLRWKGLYIDEQSDPAIQQGDERLFWCVKTQLNLGPDGKLVDNYECSPGRDCYKAL
jgi:hypothetical protein